MKYPDQKLKRQVESIPESPGVYLFKDEDGDLLYVGKAKNLAKRVRTYFQSGASLTRRNLLMARQIEDVDYIATENEIEALILESNLIKKHRPEFNIRLRDDKRYPYIKVTDEEYPRVEVVRERKPDEASYFGPYTTASSMRETLRMIRRTFPYRTCSDYKFQRRERPCLYHQIDRCLAPCTGEVSRERYASMIGDLETFLDGDGRAVARELKEKMERASEEWDFEEAAEYRDRIKALEKVMANQNVLASKMQDWDILGLALDDEEAIVQVFFVREGTIVGRETFSLLGGEEATPEELMSAFVKQYYAQSSVIPRFVLTSVEVQDSEAITEFLSEKRGRRVYLRRPQRGEKKQMMDIVLKNAQQALQGETATAETAEEAPEQMMQGIEALANRLKMKRPPERIEGYDISNMHGGGAVGSMVVFNEGLPDKSGYRRFKIKEVRGQDDYAMLQEVLYRRLKRGLEERKENPQGGGKFSPLPDLILIDGGKGQLSAGREVLRHFDLEDDLAVCALAKRRETIFLPGDEQLNLPRNSEALQLLQRVRDEAHRFAVDYHRKVRKKSSIKSVLDDIQGIGEKRRRALLRHFGSVQAVKGASVEELSSVPGISEGVARKVKSFFADEKSPSGTV